jgi:hypothetical protein
MGGLERVEHIRPSVTSDTELLRQLTERSCFQYGQLLLPH